MISTVILRQSIVSLIMHRLGRPFLLMVNQSKHGVLTLKHVKFVGNMRNDFVFFTELRKLLRLEPASLVIKDMLNVMMMV